ncbi:DUF3592 domain-containing protein [Ornithinimicrobium sp. Y1694]|uniref:DUF3592 domain-containing protein n=1 Tax=Ornithinimicrobium sp. Y1694 TaxID=3418590 RepID=UPI003CF4531E
MTQDERLQAVGTVVRWEHGGFGARQGSGERRSVPVVRFTTQDGREVEAMARSAVDLGIYRTGQRAEVRYNPVDPQDVVVNINGSTRPWVMFAILGVVGLLVLFVLLPVLFMMMT